MRWQRLEPVLRACMQTSTQNKEDLSLVVPFTVVWVAKALVCNKEKPLQRNAGNSRRPLYTLLVAVGPSQSAPPRAQLQVESGSEARRTPASVFLLLLPLLRLVHEG